MILLLAGALGCYGKQLSVLSLPYNHLIAHDPMIQDFSSPFIFSLYRFPPILQIKASTIWESVVGNVEGFLQNSRLLTSLSHFHSYWNYNNLKCRCRHVASFCIDLWQSCCHMQVVSLAIISVICFSSSALVALNTDIPVSS